MYLLCLVFFPQRLLHDTELILSPWVVLVGGERRTVITLTANAPRQWGVGYYITPQPHIQGFTGINRRFLQTCEPVKHGRFEVTGLEG